MNFNEKNVKIARVGFEYKCIYIMIDGYRLMKAANQYSLDWEEEQFTAQLINFIERCPSTKNWKIHIKPEIRIYTEEIISGEKLPKQASQIDMQMLSWQSDYEEIYHVEAKNLCENDWTKNNGSKVSSSYQLNRYVNKGVLHLMSGYYPSSGCMCGYILEGNTEKIIQKLNSILKKKLLNSLKISSPVNNHSTIYNIKYDENKLVNIFFDLK
ncbi:MAG: hypothetical protein K9N07_09620 [Candidatus Cloacimonetes bacterium]|nr:hypothetical protein [Candidatus Cloacimonadota bacterium]